MNTRRAWIPVTGMLLGLGLVVALLWAANPASASIIHDGG